MTNGLYQDLILVNPCQWLKPLKMNFSVETAERILFKYIIIKEKNIPLTAGKHLLTVIRHDTT